MCVCVCMYIYIYIYIPPRNQQGQPPKRGEEEGMEGMMERWREGRDGRKARSDGRKARRDGREARKNGRQ